MIAIIDYGMGNLGSVRNMLRAVERESVVTSDAAQIRSAEKLILPGVGAFDAGMRSLSERGLIDVLQEAVLERKVPILGICLGMQLMCGSSEEGKSAGLGWIDAEVMRFRPPAGSNLKVPHMGWNTLRIVKANPLVAAEEEQRFYFVHSYRVSCRRAEDVIATAHYGEELVAAFGAGNVLGVQFHPEKSHRFGRQLMQRFAEFACSNIE